jgi:hypothetical protein
MDPPVLISFRWQSQYCTLKQNKSLSSASTSSDMYISKRTKAYLWLPCILWLRGYSHYQRHSHSHTCICPSFLSNTTLNGGICGLFQHVTWLACACVHIDQSTRLWSTMTRTRASVRCLRLYLLVLAPAPDPGSGSFSFSIYIAQTKTGSWLQLQLQLQNAGSWLQLSVVCVRCASSGSVSCIYIHDKGHVVLVAVATITAACLLVADCCLSSSISRSSCDAKGAL